MSDRKLAKSKIGDVFKNKTVLVTGGAGSIGSALISKILEYPIKSIRILDNNEQALFKLQHSLKDSRIRFLLGSITDQRRVEMACNNVNIIFHAAAIKNIEISEFNPVETIDTNIHGLTNLIQVANRTKPNYFLNISTDKAVYPSNLYGCTKQLGERLVTWAGSIGQKTKFATVRLGNVFETQGNVFEVWKEQEKHNVPLSITSLDMKRYYCHVNEAADFIIGCIPLIKRGEIFVPKMRSYRLVDLANKISKKHKIIGIRQGEKIEEVLISDEEKLFSIDKKDMWIISNWNRQIGFPLNLLEK